MALAVVSGIADALLMITASTGLSRAIAGERPTFLQIATYLALFATSNLTLSRAISITCNELEQSLRTLRERIVDKIRRADLLTVERLGSSKLYTELTQDFDTISLRLPALLTNMQDVVVLLLTTLYIAWLSLSALVVLAIITALVMRWYTRVAANMQSRYETVIERQNALIHLIQGVIDGFKSLRLSTRKTQAVQRDIDAESRRLEGEMRSIGVESSLGSSLGIAYTFISLGCVVFLVPLIDPKMKTVIVEIATLLLFSLSPLSGLASALLSTTQLEARLLSLHGIENALTPVTPPPADDTTMTETFAQLRGFERLEYRGVTFHHRDDDQLLFTCGPIDFTLERGERVFVVGGNGSGKSTFMNLLCGLYVPDAGTVSIDGLAVTDTNRDALREQFAAVFTDFHLFDRFYGHEDVAAETVNQHLTELSLAHKVTYRDGTFSTLDLSSGQRKRLALAAALVDDKPIYLFDEWTADQDADFRLRFYDEILPGLAAQGKTCVVVTHDDRYWDKADRVIKLDGGRIVSETRPATATARP